MHLPDPTFPPLLSGHAVRSPETPLRAAQAGIARGEFGAGDVVWARNTERAALAVILEPEVARAQAVQMLPLAVVALGDALGALVPPEMPITWRWPGTICADGARVGAIRVAMGDDEGGLPAFLIIDIWLALRGPPQQDPGRDLANTTLQEEGCGDLDRTAIIESISRHLMIWLHRWQGDGFAPVHDAYLFRADGHGGPFAIDHQGRTRTGTFTGLDENGNLLLRDGDGVALLSLLDSSAMVDPADA